MSESAQQDSGLPPPHYGLEQDHAELTTGICKAINNEEHEIVAYLISIMNDRDPRLYTLYLVNTLTSTLFPDKSVQ